MAKITQYSGYQEGQEPPIPKPAEPVQPHVVTVKDGLPLKFPGSEGIGVRVLHPTNPKAPSKNFGSDHVLSAAPRDLGDGQPLYGGVLSGPAGQRRHDPGGPEGAGKAGSVCPSSRLVRARRGQHRRGNHGNPGLHRADQSLSACARRWAKSQRSARHFLGGPTAAVEAWGGHELGGWRSVVPLLAVQGKLNRRLVIRSDSCRPPRYDSLRTGRFTWSIVWGKQQ